jgi:hypothetical protein
LLLAAHENQVGREKKRREEAAAQSTAEIERCRKTEQESLSAEGTLAKTSEEKVQESKIAKERIMACCLVCPWSKIETKGVRTHFLIFWIMSLVDNGENRRSYAPIRWFPTKPTHQLVQNTCSDDLTRVVTVLEAHCGQRGRHHGCCYRYFVCVWFGRCNSQNQFWIRHFKPLFNVNDLFSSISRYLAQVFSPNASAIPVVTALHPPSL